MVLKKYSEYSFSESLLLYDYINRYKIIIPNTQNVMLIYKTYMLDVLLKFESEYFLLSDRRTFKISD